MTAVKAKLLPITPETLVIGPCLPKIAFASNAKISRRMAIKPTVLAPLSMLVVKCADEPIKKSIGAENNTLVREAKAALGA